MRSEIRSMTLEKTFDERDTLNQAFVRIVNETARAWSIECLQHSRYHPLASIKQATEMQAEAEHSKRAESLQSEGDQQSEINKIGTVLNNSHQFKILAHRLNRSRSAQDITEVYDVTSKEALNNVKIRLSEINKHISDGVNKDRENQ